jgi:hypothetical protein
MDMHSFVSQEQPAALKIDYTSKEFLGLHKSFPVLTLVVKKTCSKCKVEKPLEMFASEPFRRDGRRPSCKLCHVKYLSTYEPPKGDSFQKLGKYGRTSMCRACSGIKSRSLYAKLRGVKVKIPDGIESKLCTKCKKDLPFNRFTVHAGGKFGFAAWCIKCSGINTKAWELANPGAKVERERRQLSRDPVARLVKRLRSRLRQMVRKMGITKSLPTIQMVGCAGEEAMSKLEALFWPGMTRNNDSLMKWHVDHVTPIESFDKTDSDWQIKAFHWSNLQPLWADDNLAKAHRLNWSPTESKHKLPARFVRETKSYWKVVL